MKGFPGVTTAKRKDGTTYYRCSITLRGKHVSLGSFACPQTAGQAYREACAILRENRYQISDYDESFSLSFPKFVILLNYRNCGIYFKTPIYLLSDFFYYYLSPERYLIFDREDLFFYADHKLQMRGGYFFVCDYGSQYSILSRYGIKNYAKKGIDYIFVNQNEYDFRYENIKVINEYMGVTQREEKGRFFYECQIHVHGNFLVGRYGSREEAAAAYNKAVDVLASKGLQKKYVKNYISSLSSAQYQQLYRQTPISKRILHYSLPD